MRERERERERGREREREIERERDGGYTSSASPGTDRTCSDCKSVSPRIPVPTNVN